MRRAQASLVRWVARRVGSAKPERLARAMRGPWRRATILRVLFGAMPRAVRRKALEREEVVIEWRVTGRTDRRHDVRQLVIEGGGAAVLRGEKREPDVTITLDGVDLLLLATGNVSGSVLFVRGDVDVEGDPWLAMRLPRLFAAP